INAAGRLIDYRRRIARRAGSLASHDRKWTPRRAQIRAPLHDEVDITIVAKIVDAPFGDRHEVAVLRLHDCRNAKSEVTVLAQLEHGNLQRGRRARERDRNRDRYQHTQIDLSPQHWSPNHTDQAAND